jgi:hypothetical protein
MPPDDRHQLLSVLERINGELGQLETLVREPLTADELHQAVGLLGVLEESRRMVETKLRVRDNP